MNGPELHEAVVREFLRDHPEYIPDVQYCQVDGRRELMLNTDATIAFADWVIRTGRGDLKEAREFRKYLRRRYGR